MRTMQLGLLIVTCGAGLALVASTRPLSAQTTGSVPRRLSAALTGCDTLRPPPRDSVYQHDEVDQPVEAERLPIEDLPFRMREVLMGRSVLRFIVEGSGRIDRCSITLVEEAAPEWTDAVVRQLRSARYRGARRGGQPVRQWVYQIFVYHDDGRFLHAR